MVLEDRFEPVESDQVMVMFASVMTVVVRPGIAPIIAMSEATLKSRWPRSETASARAWIDARGAP